jgi:hypothetical protein
VNSMPGGATVSDMGRPDGKAPFESDSCISVDDATIAAFLAAIPELNSRLPEIEERILAHFGSDARLQRERSSPPGTKKMPSLNFTCESSRRCASTRRSTDSGRSFVRSTNCWPRSGRR